MDFADAFLACVAQLFDLQFFRGQEWPLLFPAPAAASGGPGPDSAP